MKDKVNLIVEELKTTAELVDPDSVDRLVEMIYRTPVIFLAGAGRSGLMVKAFAMRLMHMGKTAYVAGDTKRRSSAYRKRFRGDGRTGVHGREG